MTFQVIPSRVLALLSASLMLTGCGNSPTAGPPVGYCTAPRSLAVIVTARDSVSLASIADSARGVVQSGTYVDSLHLLLDVLVGGAQLGTYQVTVQRPGYQQWVRMNVLVTHQGPCGNVIPVQLTALLQHV